MGEALNEKEEALLLLLGVWQVVITQDLREWSLRELNGLLEAQILRSSLQLSSFPQRINYLIWCVQTGTEIEGVEVPALPDPQEPASAPQGPRPVQQFTRELAHAMRVLSYETPLEGGQETLEREGVMQDAWLRRAAQRSGILPEALQEMVEAWHSATQQDDYVDSIITNVESTVSRVDELRMLGNGVVPAQVAKAFTVLSERFK